MKTLISIAIIIAIITVALGVVIAIIIIAAIIKFGNSDDEHIEPDNIPGQYKKSILP